MPSTRVMIICFWVFIGGMLLWQFHDFNKSVDEAAAKQQEHFYFYNTNTSNTPAAPKVADGPDVQQVSCSVTMNQPGPDSFTCNVTLKNLGNAKAVDVQIMVRPYRGSSRGDVDNPSTTDSGPIPDSDPLAQLGQSVSFPDLAPGESNTQSVVFIRQQGINPGNNLNPQISFQREKPKP